MGNKDITHNKYKLNDLFLKCMCKRFLDVAQTKILILNGRELSKRIKRRIGNSDIPIICNFLIENPKVVAVNLSNNEITDIGMLEIAKSLQVNSSLMELNLRNNHIEGKGVLELARLKNMVSLKSLLLNGNQIETQALKHLALSLKSNQTLRNLDIGDTGLNIESFVYFTTVLRSNTTLQSVTLNRVLGPPGHVLQTDLIAQAVQQTLAINHTLRELHLQKIGFDGHDVQILVEGLKKNTSLLLLDLACNRFGDFGVEFLAEFLRTRPLLMTLMISKNNIGDSGARSLSQHFPFSRVVNLDISMNKMTDEGLTLLLSCLKKTPPIRTLFLRGNKIGNETCKILYRMLLSKVLVRDRLDLTVYWEPDGTFTCTDAPDNKMHHYYCLCVNTEQPCCSSCSALQLYKKIIV